MSYVAAADAPMNAAIERARSTLPEFRAALDSQLPGTSDFALKIGFPYGGPGEVEHMWLSAPFVDGDQVGGILDNSPVHVTDLAAGQRLTVPAAQVSDWMYLRSGVLEGGYTLRVLLNRMAPAERAAALEAMGFRLAVPTG